MAAPAGRPTFNPYIRMVVHAAVSMILLMAVSCGAQRDDLERRIGQLQGELTQLRAEHAAQKERLEAVRRDSSEQLTLDPARSRLRVVKVAPSEPAGAEENLAGTATPTIRGSSHAVVIDTRADDRADAAKQVFDKAESLFQAREYQGAFEAFTAFVVEFPEDGRASRATLLRGECLLALGDLQRAVDQFNAVVTAWPKSRAVAAALAGLATAHERLGHRDEAERARNRLRSQFPQALKPKS